ncbi:uncharacterized protein LOC128890371 [Hylaeus anthracinus]|uniref:uncharacterized protein LOC128890371 n=1 Tax=Hylaeus anthracinus TaxID=313031 RepID=UPI0023B9B822|nr:uncharacterized protein LOC128890371 [Hylaeus anthracinus]
MKERDINRSIDPSQKHKGRSKKYKSPTRLFDLNCWPKVMISRDNRICKKTDESSGTTSLSFSESHSSKAQAEEEEEDDDFEEEKDDEDEDEYEEEEEEEVGKDEEVSCDVQHLCCEEYGTSFEEEQGVCLISSSSEIQEALRTRESTPENVKGSKRLNESGLHCPMMKSVHQDRPIFVDLTADEKNTWKQTILKRFCDVNTLNRVDQGEGESANVTIEPRIMIADSSSKLNCKGSASLATALRDRGQCLIPMQPNRSLPIRPAPPVPTRSFRMDCSSLLFLSKPINLDIVEVEPVTSINMLSNEEACKSVDVNPNETLAVKEFASSQGYVIPQISSVESLRGVKRKINDDMDYEKDVIKENRKKKRSHEADSSQNRDECAESTIKEFLTNFCGSNETGEAQTTCSDKCVRVVSTTKEGSGGKVVPPLRLKKVVPTEADRYNNSQTTTRAEQESNYRIITGTTPRPESSTVASSCWNDMAYEKKTNLACLKTDSYKLKYRRNKLKQKLRELRNKALELAKQMANDSSFQRNTRLRQVMNRYEKQIENLSKLHSKLSTTIPISNEVVDVNDNDGCTIDDEYLLGNLNEESKESLKNSVPAASPEPPKLSPRSPSNYENLLPGEIRNSPPTLPRVCLSISSSQNSVDEDLQNSESKVWPIIEDSTKSTISAGITDSPVRCNTTEEGPADLEECMETRQQNKMNVDEEDFNVTNISLNRSEKPTQFFDSNRIDLEKKKENKKMTDETPSDRLMVQELEKIRCRGFSASMPVISSVTGGLQVTASVPAKKMFQSPSDKQLALPEEHVAQSTSYEPSRNDVSAAKVNEISQNVTSSSSQSIQLNSIGTMSKQEHFKSQQNCKGEKFPNDSTQMSSNSQSITEQFPTLGNWLARMSKKQTLKTKSKLQTVENVSFSSTEKASCIPEPEVPKITGPNTTNNILNTTPQCSTDRWQYYQHQRQQRQQRQQQQEQLLQHVAASVTLPQPVPSVPPIRPSICSPIPMNQFYPNNYAIDPYNGVALNYHPPLCPYGTYPYPPRLHPSLPGYHLPMQESLRPLQHMDKRFPLVQDPMVKYTSPTTSNLQHPNNMGFDRLRGSSAASNSNAGTCLPPLFLPSSSLPTSQQTLPRSSMSGFSTNNQYSQNRMFPDVVAAAAAAAVVAAASFDRQRDTLTSNRASTDGLQATGLTNVMNGQPPHVASSSKKVVNQDTINQTQDTNFGEEGHDNTAKYQQMQNFLFDRLTFVKTGDNFTQPNSIASGDMQAAMSSIVSTTPYRVASVSSHAQLPKNTSGNQFRNCKTPHLGKVNRSPNNLHSLSCSNCGVIGPKFKCLGCEIIFYCDERCQEKHWNVHMQWCPKKMPKLKKVT